MGKETSFREDGLSGLYQFLSNHYDPISGKRDELSRGRFRGYLVDLLVDKGLIRYLGKPEALARSIRRSFAGGLEQRHFMMVTNANSRVILTQLPTTPIATIPFFMTLRDRIPEATAQEIAREQLRGYARFEQNGNMIALTKKGEHLAKAVRRINGAVDYIDNPIRNRLLIRLLAGMIRTVPVKDGYKNVLVGICGMGRTGKTTVTRSLVSYLGRRRSVHFPLAGYVLATERQAKTIAYDKEAYDLERAKEDLEDVLMGERARIPFYNHRKRKVSGETTVRPRRYIITDSACSLYPPIDSLYSVQIYLHSCPPVRAERVQAARRRYSDGRAEQDLELEKAHVFVDTSDFKRMVIRG